MNRMYNAKVLPLLCAICLLASCHHPSYWNNSGTWGRGPGTMGWFGPFGMVIFWVIAVIVLIALVRWIMGTGRGISNNGGSKVDALEILKKRYAAGDITKEEFERIKQDIEA